MKKNIFVLSILLPVSIISGCRNLGKEKTFNGVEVFHGPKISDSLVNALGNYLVKQKFADGNDKTVQLTLDDKTYHFRMVVKPGIEKDTGLVSAFKIFSASLSADVFNGAPVMMELCNDQMVTLKTFSSTGPGNIKIFDGVQLMYTDRVTMDQVDSLGSFLIASKFADGNAKTVQITKTGTLYKFRMLVKSGIDKDPTYISNAKMYAASMSKNVFGGAPVELDMCDDHFNTLVAIPMADRAGER